MRLLLTPTTPSATRRERDAFRMLIEPQHRREVEESGAVLTIGDVLDIAPIVCTVRFRTYKQATGYLAINSKPCGRRTCTRCVVTWLCDRVSPAWALWAGQADILESTSDLTLRGDEADPGIVVATFDGGRWAIAPGDAVRGIDLDTALLRLLRDLPLEERVRDGRGTPVDWYGTVPDGTTADQINAAADAAGITIFRQRGGERWHARNVTSEQNRVFTETLWAFRRHGVDVYLPRVVDQELMVGTPSDAPPQLPVGNGQIALVPAATSQELPVGTPHGAEEQDHNRSRSSPTRVPTTERQGLYEFTESGRTQ